MIVGDAKYRKGIPIYSGFIRYFPDAIAEAAQLSRVGNDQHNPGKPLRWDRSKSGDELDAAMRHLLDAGTIDEPEVDEDGVMHLTKAFWRVGAALQKACEARVRHSANARAEALQFTERGHVPQEFDVPPPSPVKPADLGSYDEQCGDPTCWCNDDKPMPVGLPAVDVHPLPFSLNLRRDIEEDDERANDAAMAVPLELPPAPPTFSGIAGRLEESLRLAIEAAKPSAEAAAFNHEAEQNQFDADFQARKETLLRSDTHGRR